MIMSPQIKLVAAAILFALASLALFLQVYIVQNTPQQAVVPIPTATPAAVATPIAWQENPERSFELARQTGKPMMIVFYTDWCPNCKILDQTALQAPAVQAESQKFVNLRINAEKRTDYAGQFGVNSFPTVIFFDPAGRVINRFSGTHTAQEVVAKMSAAQQRMTGA
jgi:thiol:disulfide interchange protein